jgi:hypothetical protein
MPRPSIDFTIQTSALVFLVQRYALAQEQRLIHNDEMSPAGLGSNSPYQS